MKHLNSLPRQRSTAIAVGVAAFVAMLVGCGPGSQPYSDATASTAYAAPPPPPADSMHLLDSAYQRVHGLFTANFDAGRGKPLLHTAQEIPFDTLLHLAPAGQGLHALHIDYGLSGDSIRLAFCTVALSPTGDSDRFSYTVGNTVKDWNRGRFTDHDRTQWRARYQYDASSATVYYSRVRVRHTPTGSFAALDPHADAGSDVLAWEDEVLELHAQNAQGHPDSTLHAVFRCIGRRDAEAQLRHGMALHMRLRPVQAPNSGYRDLLDNNYYPTRPLHMHGADFGSMNPPGNGYYELPPQ